jgi:hypothetical protein
MPKTLKDFLEVYKPKSPDEQKFVDKHVVIKHKDRNGNGDDVFNGNTKYIKRKEERKGYDVGEDEKVYEELKGDQHKLDHNKNGKLDAHDFKLMRKKKKVTEEVDEVDESYQELMALKNNIARNEKKMKAIPGIHPEKKRLAIQIEKDTKRHKELFSKQWSKNEEVDLDEAVTVNKRNYSWGKMVTVHQGASTTYPLHPEHQEKIRKLSDGDKTTFKDETGATVHAHRSGDTVHLKKPGSSNRTTAVAHSHFAEEVDIDTVLDEALDLLMSIDEKTLTPAEMKKREEVVKAIKRENPKMDKSMAYAVATKTAKRVAEDTEELDESAKIAAHLIKRYGDNVRKSHVRSAANDFGVDASKLAKAVRTKLGKTSLAEEEQIDELSATTKDAYAQKAGKQLTGLFKKSGSDADAARKYYNRKNTVRKIANEEVEELDELSAKKLSDYTAAATDARRHRDLPTKKLDNRYKGVMRAGDKMNKGFSKVHATEGTMPTADEPTEANKKTAQKVRDMMAKEKKPVKEDTQIDELSKNTMLKYLSANKKSDKAAQEKGDYSKSDKRMRGTDVAVRKYTASPNSKYVRVPATEEVEHIDELSKKTMGSYIKKASGAEQPKNVMSPKNVPLTKIAAYQGDSETGYFGKRFNQHTYDKAERLRKNRETGIKRATDKLTKEEVEAIDELSKKTLGSYVNKAAFKIGDQGVTAGLKIQNNEPAGKNFKKMGNRQKGIERAVGKLTKEDIINRTVEKYVPEEIKYTPEERLLKRINGLSETHVHTLLGLFEDLNKDNQNKMIETVETREGINQILNFVLENRGK